MQYSYCPKCGAKYGEQNKPNQFACRQCGFVFYVNSKPTASTLIIKDSKVLLGKRVIEPAKGMWDVIGGFLDLGELPEDGAKREAKEETGLDVKIESLVGFFVDTYGDTGDVTLNIYYTASVVGGEMRAQDDVEELRWFTIDEIPKEIAFKNSRDMLDVWLAKK